MPGFFKRTEVEMKQLIDRLAAEGTPEPQIVELVAEAWDMAYRDHGQEVLDEYRRQVREHLERHR